MIRWLLSLWRSPSAQKRDPGGFRRNQAGHAALGTLAVLALGPSLPALVAVGVAYAAWEVSQFRYAAEPWDAAADWAFVASGAALGALALAGWWPPALAVLCGIAVALWLGGRART